MMRFNLALLLLEGLKTKRIEGVGYYFSICCFLRKKSLDVVLTSYVAQAGLELTILLNARIVNMFPYTQEA